MLLYRHILDSLASLPEARALAQWVLEEALGMTLAQALLCKDSDLSAESREELGNIIERLLAGVPVQYAVGHTTFCGRRFAVRPGVLIPRPETEELVRLVGHPREGIAGHGKRAKDRVVRLLDIGTGSGCIAVSLALEGWEVTAWDISEEALAVAKENAERLGATVLFEQRDILGECCVQDAGGCVWDIIVSNPPYVRDMEAGDMEATVLEHEPHLALFVPDDDPLRFYRAIARFGQQHLVPQGLLYFEINQYLADETADLMRSLGYTNVQVFPDQFGNPRMLKCQLP